MNPYSGQPQTDFDPAASRRALRRRVRGERLPVRLRELLVTVVASIWVVAMVLLTLLWLRSFGFGSEGVAARHVIAWTGCGAAREVGLAPARRGDPGYWPKLDPAGSGVSCGNPAPRHRG